MASGTADRQAGLLRRRIDLLERIGRCGSISGAARSVKLSYKAAWQALDAMNNLSAQPLVKRTTGGSGGGGTVLTAAGRRLVAAARAADEEYRVFLRRLGRSSRELGAVWGWMRRLAMKTSARNQFLGRVSRVRRGAVNAEVELRLKGQDRLTAIITKGSLDDLGLKVGQDAIALVKAQWVMLAADSKELQVSARNKFRGTAERVARGAVNTEVVLRLAGGDRLAAIVTVESERALKIKAGTKLWAFFKASSPILAVE
ncbi:MAG TPA: molybdenum-dependent transcriptional regulator [Elusimicrobia bacterium]|nr:molybdenum-dependent transcriptional regulator [Elusimicrobiota bacterium]